MGGLDMDSSAKGLIRATIRGNISSNLDPGARA